MDKHEALNAHDAIAVREPEVAYAGSPGQTRYDCVHLATSDGSLRSVRVCRTINVQTHPELKALALTGVLHRLEDGRELALAFAYHDPEARKFVLVVPSALAHLELREWSKLMAEIADDTGHPVPAYVKELTTVVGTAALAEFLETRAEPDGQPELEGEPGVPGVGSASRELELLERDSRFAQRERELAEQERVLVRTAEGLASRETELHRLQEQLDATRDGLEVREAELRDKHPRRTGNWQEVGIARADDTDAAVVSEMPRRVANDSVFEGPAAYGGNARHTHPPPLPQAQRRSRPPPLPLRPRRTPPPLVGHPAAEHNSSWAPRRDSNFAGSAEDSRPPRLRSTPPPLPLHDALVTEPHDPEPEIGAPENFLGQRAGHMLHRLADDELWLFVCLDEEHASAFRHGAELALQYVDVEGYPIVVLSLVDQHSAMYAVRLVLDGRAPSDLQVLEHLSRSYRARVALYIETLYIETVTVASLGEGVAQAISDKLAKLPGDRAHASAAEAIARVTQAPPPLWNDDLPFGPVRRETPTIVTVLAAVEQLAAWLRPEKLAEATLTYSVPRHVIDATIRRVVRSAIAFGVALPDELLELAVEHGAASDELTAVREQLHAFRQRVENRQNDLGVEATRTNWSRLIAAAEARHLDIDEATLALARAEPALVSTAPAATRVFETLTSEELKQKLLDSGQRVEAIRELCVRGHVSAIELVLPLLDSLRPDEAAVAAARLAALGEAAGDGLIAALGSPNGSVRQCAALALGKLQLRRGIVPLLRQLEAEELPLHAEIARAFGDFGAPALRSVAQVIPSATRPDRLVLALAHLANHGSAREVERLENDPDGAVAQAARKAMARRARMEWEDLSVREQRTLTDASSAARLSQAFYAEAAKVDI